MADEIQMSARLYASKGGASINNQTFNVVTNMTGTDMGQQTQEVGSASETLDITADLSLPYKVLVYNMDLVSAVGIGDVGSNVSGIFFMEIPPQQFTILPYVKFALYVKCMTAGSSAKIFAQFCEI
jgi:hypothetical protein